MIKVRLKIFPPEEIEQYPHTIKNVLLQALPREGDKFDITGKTGIPKAFGISEEHDGDSVWNLQIREIEHSYDADEAEHSIEVHADLNLDTFWA
ncbi:hypothetical protein [Nostoc sp.]|uniref:hypothetical protein n=1 Tax=Nostoc sp. TaxID=1180 RepID=UPI002FF48DBF